MTILKFSQKFQILIGFSPKRAQIAARLLNDVRIINDFQQSTKITFIIIIIKISLLNKKYSHNSWKFSQVWRFPLIFQLSF